MNLGYLEIFGIAADCFQVLMIALMAILLMRYRKKTASPDWSEWASSEANPFMHEFMLQSLKHQAEQAFDHIEKTIQTERGNLLNLYELGDQPLKQENCGLADEYPKPAPFQIDDEPLPEVDGDSANRYRQVPRLAADGMNARRISKQLAIPLGEVELVLKMAAVSQKNFDGDELIRREQPRRAAR